jgi:hypothetical protein
MNRTMALAAMMLSIAPAFSEVKVNFDESAHFSRYKTYRLVRSTDAQSSQALTQTGLTERIAGFVEERLAAAGLRPVTTGGDLVISYRIHLAERPQKIDLTDGVGPTGLGWGDTRYIATVRVLHEWDVVIDMVDPQRNRLVFEGSLNQTTSSKPGKSARQLTKALDEILEKYPPRPSQQTP